RPHTRGALDGLGAQLEIAAHVIWRFEGELAVEVTVIADRVSFAGDTPDERGPLLSVPTEYEECRLHITRGERVEDEGCRVGIRAVVECQRHGAIARR